MDLNKGHSFNIHILISLVMFSSVIKISGSPAASNCICSPNQDPSPYVIFLIYNNPYLFRTKTIFSHSIRLVPYQAVRFAFIQKQTY